MSERALAHVEKIVDIRPIEGADRVELATVLGWHVMVAKEQFKVGDLAIYIEIDSKVPNKEPFLFLEKKHFAVKTQKYFKGTVLSQGLLMSLSDFGMTEADVKEGQDLTEKLGITYYVPEDNQRKAPSVDKYKKMAQRNQKLFSKKPIRWLMRRTWGKKLLFLFFGRKKDKKGGWPEWVVKTDETRCLAGKTKIQTDHGLIPISKIVNQRLPVNVKSVNKNGEIEYRPIVSYQKYPSDKNLIDIEYIQYKKGDTKHNRIVCTKDHRLYINGEYKRAEDIKTGDKLSRIYEGFSRDVLPFFYGIMLGDGGLYYDKRHKEGRAIFSYCQSINHEEYFDLINSVFGTQKFTLGSSGYTGERSIKSFSFSDAFLEDKLISLGTIKNRKFVITKEFCDMLTIPSIAVWYMDDGTLRHKYSNNEKPTAEISSNSFSKEENLLLIDRLKELGINCSLKKDNKRGFYSIYITVDGTRELCRKIAPYVPQVMRYKLIENVENSIIFEQTLWDVCEKEENIISCEVVDVKSFVNHSNGYHVGCVYDIEVEENHNYFANNVLSHNCQNIPWIVENKDPWISSEKLDGSSGSYTMRRVKKRFKPTQYDYYVCSRNVVQDSENSQCYYDTNVYLEISKKYEIEKVLKGILIDHPEWEWVTIQGEIYGDGIQKRDYSLDHHDFAAFNFVTSEDGRWNSVKMKEFLAKYGIPSVPILSTDFILPDTIDELLEMATGKSVIDGKPREGLVFRSRDGKQSFKAVSNEYLLKYH